jgi:hypothetical protein
VDVSVRTEEFKGVAVRRSRGSLQRHRTQIILMPSEDDVSTELINEEGYSESPKAGLETELKKKAVQK